MRIAKSLGVFVVMFAFCSGAYAGVKIESQWRNPDAQPVSYAGKKIAALVISPNRAARRAAEDALADEFLSRGAEGIPAYTLIPDGALQDTEQAKALLHEAGVNGVVALRPLPAGGVPLSQDTFKDAQYKSFWGFYGDSWKSNPEPTKDVKVLMQVMVYSLDQDMLLWSGSTQVKSSEMDQIFTPLISAVAKEMEKKDLFKKEK